MESLCFRVVKCCPWMTLNSEGKRCISRSPFKRLTKSGCNDRKRLRRPRVNLPILTSLRFADPTAVVSEEYRQIAAMPELPGRIAGIFERCIVLTRECMTQPVAWPVSKVVHQYSPFLQRRYRTRPCRSHATAKNKPNRPLNQSFTRRIEEGI
jgi:hypothetical protein